MKNYDWAWVFCICVSCDFFTDGKPAHEKILRQELKSINWEELDRYPLFTGCDETADKQEQKQCFETTLANAFSEALKKQSLTVRHAIQDTLWISLRITNRGEITIIHIEKDSLLAKEVPELDSIFKTALSEMPRLYPPLKRAIPVAARFKLPLVVQAE